MKIQIDKQVIEQALYRLENCEDDWISRNFYVRQHITALRSALAESVEQEPVAWMNTKNRAVFVDPALTMTMRFPEYECPVHGSVGTAGGVIFTLHNRTERRFCFHCIEDKLIAAGVCELTEVSNEPMANSTQESRNHTTG